MPLDSEHFEPAEHMDGVGNNRIMAGTSHGISLGTAALLMMGLTHRVSGTARAVSTHANGMPETMRLSANSKPTKSGHIAHTVEVPMMVEISSERCYDAQTLSDEQAQEHGYATAKAWRKELGLKKDQPATIYSYPVALTPSNELPHDRDRSGSRLNAIMDAAYDAWRSGDDKSIKRARKYFELQPEDVRAEALKRIAPYKALKGESNLEWLSKKGKKLQADGASAEELQAHLLPSDVRAQRMFEPELTPEPAVEKGPRPKRGNHRLEAGDGWEVKYAKPLTHPQAPTSTAAAQPEADAETETSPRTQVAKLGNRDPKGNARRHATRRESRTRDELDYDNVADEVMYTTSLDASVIARAASACRGRDDAEARRMRYKGKPHPRIKDGDEDEPLKSPRGR